MIAPKLLGAGADFWSGTPSPAWLAPPGQADPIWLARRAVRRRLARRTLALQYLQAMLLATTGQAAMRDLRSDVFAHIQKLHLGFFDRYPVGRLVTRATNDVENVAEMFSAGIVAARDRRAARWSASRWCCSCVGRAARGWYLPGGAARSRSRRSCSAGACATPSAQCACCIARINATLQETVTGMKVVQLFTREARNQREFEQLNAEHRDAWIDSIRYDAALFAVVELAAGIIVRDRDLEGDRLRLGGHALRLHRLDAALLHAAARSLGEVLGDAVRDGEPRAHLPAARHPACRCAIAVAAPELRGARLAPARGARAARSSSTTSGSPTTDEDWVLRDVSFRVAPGEKVALVGATGAGKTTSSSC